MHRAGHLQPDPSAVTNFKTRDFGTGKADPRVVGLMTTRHPDVEPKEMLLPNKYRQVDIFKILRCADDGYQQMLQSLNVIRSAPRIVRSLSRTKSYEDDDADFDPFASNGGDSPPATPPLADGAGAGWKVLETRQLTKFEQNAMEKAKERHKSSIGKPKVMMGREFAGDAFMSTPSVVVFKDFEVGQVYTLKVAVTNRSYDMNTYRCE